MLSNYIEMLGINPIHPTPLEAYQTYRRKSNDCFLISIWQFHIDLRILANAGLVRQFRLNVIQVGKFL
jgi:hypothetical protein